MQGYPQLHDNVQLRLAQLGIFPQHIDTVLLDEPYLNTRLIYAVVQTKDGRTYLFNGFHQPYQSTPVPSIDLPFGRF